MRVEKFLRECVYIGFVSERPKQQLRAPAR